MTGYGACDFIVLPARVTCFLRTLSHAVVLGGGTAVPLVTVQSSTGDLVRLVAFVRFFHTGLGCILHSQMVWLWICRIHTIQRFRFWSCKGQMYGSVWKQKFYLTAQVHCRWAIHGLIIRKNVTQIKRMKARKCWHFICAKVKDQVHSVIIIFFWPSSNTVTEDRKELK